MLNEHDRGNAPPRKSSSLIAESFTTSVFYGQRNVVWFVAIIFAIVASVSSGIHVFTEYDHDAGNPSMAYFITDLVNMVTMLAFVAMYPMLVFFVVGQSASASRVWLKYIFSWLATAVVLMSVLTISRNFLAPFLSNGVVWVYPPAGSDFTIGFDLPEWEKWHYLWSHGIIHATELIYVILLCAVPMAFVPIARLAPGTGLLWLYALTICVIQWVLTLLYFLFSPVITWDFDPLLGGTFTDSLSFQLVFLLLPIDSVSTVTSPVLLLFIVVTWLVFKRTPITIEN